MDGLTIGEVARRAGLRTSAIRYYEEAGILPAPERVNGRRRYDPDVVRRLDVVRLAKGAGLTLAEIRTLFHGFGKDVPPPARWHALATAKLKELDEQLERIARMRRALRAALACGCVRIEDCAGEAGIRAAAGGSSWAAEAPAATIASRGTYRG
ncbi:MAG: MerR family transcriptional regulator [Gammaproteobacteria bacterium]|nr:MerR family transcriptional regulator [Gemmatimonadota bacterium]NIU74602.1 MerR family transcriptional regulator [Gammaproteobacteria bacterium]